jgi:hypothetical protein
MAVKASVDRESPNTLAYFRGKGIAADGATSRADAIAMRTVLFAAGTLTIGGPCLAWALAASSPGNWEWLAGVVATVMLVLAHVVLGPATLAGGLFLPVRRMRLGGVAPATLAFFAGLLYPLITCGLALSADRLIPDLWESAALLGWMLLIVVVPLVESFCLG